MTEYDLANLKLINAQKEEEQKKCSEAINLVRNFVLNKKDNGNLPAVRNCDFKPLIDEINKSKFAQIQIKDTLNYSWITRGETNSGVVNYTLNAISNK